MKKSFRIPITIFILFAICFTTKAQVLPPDLLCVKNDTLIWDIPVNACGPFISYQIFTSQDPVGPYSLLTEITDQAQTFYFHTDGGSGLWYYYMQSNFDCVGEIVLSSDTLDNRSPEASPIQSVSVEEENVTIKWDQSPSPEVSAYIIYRSTPIGTVPIDTVYNSNQYIDTTAAPDLHSEIYYIVAMDECGNTSIFDEAHHTIFLSAEVKLCEHSIALSWSPYQGWAEGIGTQQVWMSINDANPELLIGSLEATTTSYTFNAVVDGENYCFYVKALREGTAIDANSNEICLTPDIVQPNNELIITSVEVTPENKTEIHWKWNANAEINTIRVFRSSDSLAFEEIATQATVLPLDNEGSFTDNTSTPSLGKLYYQIQTVDDCDTVKTSNTGATIFLQGEASPNQTNILQWTGFDIGGGQISNYEIYKVTSGGSSLLQTVNGSTTSFSDPIDAADMEDPKVCYYILALADISLADGSEEAIQMRSNTICLEQTARIITPTAFVPSGRNQIFKPVIQFGEAVKYQMLIFDRWGGKIFESTSLDVGWDGEKDGKDMPQGPYTYLIRVTQANGSTVEDAGIVVLLR